MSKIFLNTLLVLGLNKLMTKLPYIRRDLANHFVYGFVIFVISSMVFSSVISFFITLLFALLKETYDYAYFNRFDLDDIIFTIIPAIIMIICLAI